MERVESPDPGSPTPQQGEGDATSPGRTRPWSDRRLRLLAWLGAVLGTLLVGAGVGQLLWPATVTVQQVVVAPSAEGSAAPQSLSFPSVEGLDESTARAAIADAGFSGAKVTTTSVAAAGPAGFVVIQQPVAGTPSDPAAVTVSLTISREADMPDLTGKTLAEARAAVGTLWGVVQVESVTTADEPAGTVLSTVPKAGEPMTVEVTVRVADGGASLALVDLNAVGRSGCSEDADVSVNGALQSSALTCYAYAGRDPAYAEYAIGRHATYLEATIGLDDRGDTGEATLRVLGDGKRLAQHRVAFGTSRDIRVEVSGVLRLRLEVEGRTADARPQLVLGTVRLVGDPLQLDQIG